jgi:hypothetical protein
MNMMKIALLGSAALATVTISARADDLSDLKAQIEALNSRVAQVEAAPAVPAGYQLLTVSEGKAIVIPGLEADKNYGDTATVISVLPTADAPAGPSTALLARLWCSKTQLVRKIQTLTSKHAVKLQWLARPIRQLVKLAQRLSFV